MEHCPWVAQLVKNPMVYYCLHKNPPMTCILTEINPVHALISYSYNISFPPF